MKYVQASTSMIQETAPAARWLRSGKHNPNARLRLFCFPYAGGAASIYRSWSQHLSADIEVCAMQLPGRESRIRDKPFTSVHELIQALMPNLLPYLDKPFTLFGHSMGALIVYELAQQLQHQVGRTPTHLFVSGRRAPFLPEPEPPLHSIRTDIDFLQAIHQRYQNIPDIMFRDAELRELFVPLLRADFTLVETYRGSARTRLSCPIVALGGTEDGRVSEVELRAWQALTESAFDLHLLPGGHFYVNEQAEPLLATLHNYLSASTGG